MWKFSKMKKSSFDWTVWSPIFIYFAHNETLAIMLNMIESLQSSWIFYNSIKNSSSTSSFNSCLKYQWQICSARKNYLRDTDDINMYFSKTFIKLLSNSALFLLLCNQNSCPENGAVWKEGVNALPCAHKFSANSISVASFNFVFIHSMLSTTTHRRQGVL